MSTKLSIHKLYLIFTTFYLKGHGRSGHDKAQERSRPRNEVLSRWQLSGGRQQRQLRGRLFHKAKVLFEVT